jgi:hypothetical protein
MLNIAHNCLVSSGFETSEKFHIRQQWSCADNPHESGESCERILIYGMLFGESRCDQCDPYSSDTELPTKYGVFSDRPKK